MNRSGRSSRPRRPPPPPGHRYSRRGNLIPLGPVVPRVSRPVRRPRNNVRNPQIPNTFRPRRSGGRRQADNLTLVKQEYWFSVEKGVNKYTFIPGASGIPHLDRFGLIHESSQVRHFKVFYKPSAGTTVPGNITLGVDYQPENERKANDIKILDTTVSNTIFTASSLKLIVNRVQKNVSWLGTAASASPHKFFALYVDADTDADKIGQIWVSYKIVFSDPTSPSGPSSVNKQNISTVSASLASDISVSQPNMLDVQHEDDNFLSVAEPTHSVVIEEEAGTTYETKLNINDSLPVGSLMTIGSTHSVPASHASHMYRASPPKIKFKYTDGTDIPDGTIVPLKTHNPQVFRAAGMSSDIFATIFKLLKPLAKPAWGLLNQVVQPLISFSPSPGVQSTDPVEYPSDQLTTFAFTGDSATISVPVTDRDSITSRFPVTIMQSMGHGYATAVKNFVAIYSHNLISHPTSWLATVDDDGGTGYSTVLKTVFRHPDKKTKAFQNGDLVTIFVTTVPIERGIGDTVHTPFAAPLDDDTVKNIIAVLEVSSLSQNSEVDKDAPRLKILDFTNQSSSSEPDASVGVWFTGRFVSSFSENKYQNAVISFPIGYTLTGVDTSSSLDAVSDPGVKYFHKPSRDYNMALGFLTFQFFPTASQDIQLKSSDHQFTITRVNDDVVARHKHRRASALNRHQLKIRDIPEILTDSEIESDFDSNAAED